MMFVVDVLAQKISNKYGFVGGGQKGKNPICKDLATFNLFLISKKAEIDTLEVTAKEIREMLDLYSDRWPISKVKKIVDNLTQVIITIENAPGFYVSESEKWEDVEISSPLCILGKTKVLRKVSNRWKTHDLKFFLNFNTPAGKLFVQNLSNGGYTFLNLKAYKLREVPHNICRELSLWKHPERRFRGHGYSFDELANIAGLKVDQYWFNKRRAILKALKELKEKGLVYDFKEVMVKDKDVRFRYIIYKEKPRERKRKKLKEG